MLFLVLGILGGVIALGDVVLHACGAKFLVSSRGARYQKVLANIEPTRILWWYDQDESTPEDERWNPETEKWLEELGHSLEVTFDADSFLAAAKNGGFDVMLVHIEEARELQDQITALAPDAALLPILKFPTQSVYSAARQEFGIVMKFPTTQPKFLAAIEKAARSVRL
jgi:hypothetical protein